MRPGKCFILLIFVLLVLVSSCAATSLIPINLETVRKTVVFLFRADANGQPDKAHPEGTAFLVEIPLTGRPTQSYFALVTARHVVDPIWACTGTANPAFLYARLNKKEFDGSRDESGVDFVKVTLLENGRKRWSAHEKETIDAAVIPVDPKEFTSRDVATVKLSDFATPEEQKSVGIGDEVISAGLVPNFLGEKRNYPFFKFGRVSSIPEEDIFLPCANGAAKPHTVWFLAATLIGGNSGSPIFVLPPGNLLMTVGNTRPFFVGLQSIAIIAGEIAGMTPSQYVFEILNSLHLPDANMSRGPVPKVQPPTK